jgi:chromosome segregation ATPase
LSRELAEINRRAEVWQTHASEQLKPIDGLARQVIALVESREDLVTRIAGFNQAIDRLVAELVRLDAQSKADQAAIERVAEAIGTQAARSDANGAAIWQAGERFSAFSLAIDQVRVEIKIVAQRGDALTTRLELVDDAIKRLNAVLGDIASDLRSSRREATDRSESLSSHLEIEVAELKDQAESRYRLAVEHVRRTTAELIQQLRELEAGVEMGGS